MAVAEERIAQALRNRDNTLDLADLGLTTVPESIGQLTALQSLKLYNNQITSLPESLGQLTALQGLYLYNNQITSLPESLGQLTALQRLFLHNNQITSLPESLGQLTALQTLYLYDNQLVSVPESLGRLTALRLLYLSGNQLARVPESAGQLTALQKLNLSSNQLTSVPESLGQLTALQLLDLSDNQLTSLPESLERLVALQILDLSDNNLTSLPEAIKKLPKLVNLFLHRNSTLGILDEVLGPEWGAVFAKKAKSKPPQEILDYYFTHCQATEEVGTEPLMEAKVLVLGEASVGKSCLIAAISENKKRKELDGKGTSGIVRKLWEAPVKDNALSLHPKARGVEKLRLNLWDFGGQEIYHSAHTLFLTRRAIYLIVVSKRDNERQNNVDYWLRMATSFGGTDAIIYVVVNKSDEKVGHPPDEQALQRKYPQVRGFLHTSCDDLTGISEARATIVRQALQLDGVRLPVAKTWLATKNALEKMKNHTLSLTEWAKLCGNKKVTTPEAQRELLHLCDRLGTVRYFPTKTDDAADLCNTAILNPDWVTVGIYALFDDAALNKRGGLLTRPAMEGILRKRSYPTEHAHIIEEVMRRFFLLYDSAEHGDDHQMLIPLMLPEREPAMDWPKEGTLEFVYQYEVVPAGLVPAFMARRHKNLSLVSQPWRHGCVLEFDGCRARVISDAETKRVLISVTGPDLARRDALDKVRFTFEELHGAVENLSVQQLIPVPGNPDAPMLDYDFVRDLEWKGKSEFDAKGARRGETITVNVRQALDGVRGETRRQNDEAQRQTVSREGVNVQVTIKNENKSVMSHNEQNISGGTFHAPVGVNQAFSNCYNTIKEVESETTREALEKLLQAVERFHPQMDDAKAKSKVERQLKLLTEEAAQPEPDKGQLQLSGKGLIEAAETCAQMAAPVIAATKAVLGLFGVVLP